MACVGVPPKGSGPCRLFDSHKGVPAGWGKIDIPKAPESDGQAAILEGLELNKYEIDPTLRKYLVAQAQIRRDGQAAQAARAISPVNTSAQADPIPEPPPAAKPEATKAAEPAAAKVEATKP